MANGDNIKNYSAADIERYHKGLLSPSERHALEKAALEDPFLADALEGYTVPGLDIQSDLAALRKQLENRTATAPIVAMPPSRKSLSPLLRVAAVLIVMLGAGLLVYQFAYNKKDTELAQAEPVAADKKASEPGDSSVTMLPEKRVVEQVEKGKDKVQPSAPVSTPAPLPGEMATVTDKPAKDQVAAVRTETNTAPGSASGGAAPVTTNPAKAVTPSRKTDVQNQDDKETGLAREETRTKAQAKKQEEDLQAKTRSANAGQRQQKEVAATANNAAESGYYRDRAMNTFRGRVTDASNTGLPFANVTNLQDNVGTYTDANGNFTLTSPDSVLNVQIRSLGYDNNNIQLRNSVPSNQVVMQEDRKELSEVVISQKPNAAARAKAPERTLIEPEPVDGWVKYDSYLANNLNIPDDFIPQKSQSDNSVQVSFEVDKNGEPVNIRVEKSLCSTCDKEAIRLIKEGPKFKRMAKKKGRTTVTINF